MSCRDVKYRVSFPTAAKDGHILIPETCGCIILPSKRAFADVTKLRDRKISPVCVGGPSVQANVLIFQKFCIMLYWIKPGQIKYWCVYLTFQYIFEVFTEYISDALNFNFQWTFYIYVLHLYPELQRVWKQNCALWGVVAREVVVIQFSCQWIDRCLMIHLTLA